jgi:phage shock protein A
MSSLVDRLRAEAGHKFEESLERLLDEAANRIEALENWAQLHRGDTLSLSNEVEQCRLEIEQLGRELAELSQLRPQPTDDKINEAFKRATRR